MQYLSIIALLKLYQGKPFQSFPTKIPMASGLGRPLKGSDSECIVQVLSVDSLLDPQVKYISLSSVSSFLGLGFGRPTVSSSGRLTTEVSFGSENRSSLRKTEDIFFAPPFDAFAFSHEGGSLPRLLLTEDRCFIQVCA